MPTPRPLPPEHSATGAPASAMPSPSLALGQGPNASRFTITDNELVVDRPADKKWPVVRTLLRNVLWAGVDDGNQLHVSLLAKKKPTSPMALLHVAGTVPDTDIATATAFTDSVMQSAYYGNPLLVIHIPPSSHSTRLDAAQTTQTHHQSQERPVQGKSAQIFRKKIEPIFRAARCPVDVTFTERGGHAQDIAQTLPLDQYDAIVVLSGDGIVYELLNGFAAHTDPSRAFRMPVAPVPMGSGNGSSLNLLGKANGQRTFSFMTSCLGLMASLDLGTEHLRFMGSQHRPYSYRISIKVAETDKDKMMQNREALRAQAQAIHGSPISTESSSTLPETGVPELKHIGPDADKDGWITFDKSFNYFYAGKGPFVSVDLMQFPVSHPDDGFIDVVIAERQHYFKAYAYRVEPISPDGYLSIDGEEYPHEPFEVEVHQGLGTFLSMYGHYKNEFHRPPEHK
uniref:Efflux pump FUB11 (Fusaric acid biosynthesis protein 11) n=1 Tax=Ganoderma boninense TaxID=34458 RepID=A0A5K1K080_9APHY|nr:Efflux pump FUB11 (Fusaric acid biosynthesis protein 11) [Ganoderma boninense]